MKRFKTIKLGTVCVDKATRLQGTVTHCAINMGGKVNYFFQPKGLDENGQPVRKLFLELERLEIQALRDFENINEK